MQPKVKLNPAPLEKYEKKLLEQKQMQDYENVATTPVVIYEEANKNDSMVEEPEWEADKHWRKSERENNKRDRYRPSARDDGKERGEGDRYIDEHKTSASTGLHNNADRDRDERRRPVEDYPERRYYNKRSRRDDWYGDDGASTHRQG